MDQAGSLGGFARLGLDGNPLRDDSRAPYKSRRRKLGIIGVRSRNEAEAEGYGGLETLSMLSSFVS